jgi:hypothetical protein
MGIHINPGHEGEESNEHPFCPGCGKRHAPEDSKLQAINVLELVKNAAETLNMSEKAGIPTDGVQRMIASFVGVFAENISDETWERVLSTPMKPCGHPECQCHTGVDRLLKELHLLKVLSDEAKERDCDCWDEEDKK